MRIAIFSEVYTPDKNGVATHTKTLKEGLERAGHKVLVVTADKRAWVHYIDGNNVLRCPAVRMKKAYGFGLSTPTSERRQDLVQAFAPDVIHIQSEFSVGLSGVTTARRLRLPLVYTAHTMYDDTYVGYIVPKPFVRRAKRLLYAYIHYLTRCATAIIVPSERARRFIAGDICAGDGKCHLVPNAIDWPAMDPEQVPAEARDALRDRLGLSEARRTAIYVGRLGKEKSIDVLLRWWAEALRPDDGWQLIIVGGGPEASTLRAQAETSGIAPYVTFTGAVEHAEIRTYLALSDVFMTASLTENNSISMLEAMASGLMVLERYDEGTADQIEVGVNGDFFSDGAQMAAKLRAIGSLSDADMAAQKQRVRSSIQRLDTPEMAQSILTVYSKAIATYRRMPGTRFARPS